MYHFLNKKRIHFCDPENIVNYYYTKSVPFSWLTPPGPNRDTTYRERDHIHTFLTTQGHGGPPRMRDLLNTETTRTRKTRHTIHAPIHTNKANINGWLWRPNDIRGPCGPKASWHLSDRWGNPRKKLTKGTCPDRGSNPCPLRDRCACYRLFHSGGLNK